MFPDEKMVIDAIEDDLDLMNGEDSVWIFRNVSTSNYTGVDQYYYFNTELFFSHFRFRLETFLWKYISLIIVLISFFGNLTVVIVLLQKRSRYFSTSIFITSLAFADFFVSLGALEGWLTANAFVEFSHSNLDCKLRLLVPQVSQYASIWMLVAISIERALIVKVPHKVKTICTVKFARCYVIIVWVLSLAKAALIASIASYISTETGKGCYIKPKFQNLYYADLVLNTALAVIIPYPCILVCSLLTISVLLHNTLRKSRSNKSKVQSITVTLLLVNLMFLFSVTPAVGYEIYTSLWIDISNSRSPLTFEDYFNDINLLNLFTFIAYLHHSFNFFIYFLSGSRFRNEAIRLLKTSFCSIH